MTAPTPYGIVGPDPEALALAYFTPLMSPVPVTTRLPKPAARADTVTPWLRLEAGGGFQRDDEIMFDLSLILHSYAPQNEEPAAAKNLRTALGYGARGIYTFTVTDPDGVDWWVAHSKVQGNLFKQNDPLVNMPRYKAMLMWRIPGQALAVS
jgi:hypothetical protein